VPHRVKLIHWNEGEAAERAAQLKAAGYAVDARRLDQAGLRALRGDPPAAFVIDLSRLPSQGRDVATALREFKATRHVPLMFVGGAPDKVARVRRLLPDATLTTWARIRGALRRALREPVVAPVVPGSVMAGYSGTPLPKKLGIRAGDVVALVDAPDGFEPTLGSLPGGVVVERNLVGARNITLWFVTSRRALEGRIRRMTPYGAGGGLWLIWPKQASGAKTDLTQVDVRRIAMANGLVDFKVCAVDQTWSGLRFSKKKQSRP
jgi:hypothetical protein